jgi:hypothetical protein
MGLPLSLISVSFSPPPSEGTKEQAASSMSRSSRNQSHTVTLFTLLVCTMKTHKIITLRAYLVPLVQGPKFS